MNLYTLKLWMMFILLTPLSLMAVEIHVAPTGNDSNPGTVSAPLKSLAAARDTAHASGRLGKEPCTVVIHAGTYRLKQPLVFGPADSGSKDAPVV